jgi:antitoxin component YwqK of YwqJK toxin-antitoxin module
MLIRVHFIALFLMISSLSHAQIRVDIKDIEVVAENDSVNLLMYNSEAYSGIVFSNYVSGKAKEVFEVLDGKLHGGDTLWYEDGQLKQVGNFFNGVPHGKFETWYEDGQRDWLYYKEMNAFCKEFTSWWRNGQVQKKTVYDDNCQPHGEMISYREDGTMFYYTEFNHGTMVVQKEFNEFGELVNASNILQLVYDERQYLFANEISGTQARKTSDNGGRTAKLIQEADLVFHGEEPQFRVYPNPFTSQFTIEMTPAEETIIEIIDITGKVIYRADASSGTIMYDASHLSTGLYFVKQYQAYVLIDVIKVNKI